MDKRLAPEIIFRRPFLFPGNPQSQVEPMAEYKIPATQLRGDDKHQQRDRLRVFWSRFVSVMGMIWGFKPLITLPGLLFNLGEGDETTVVCAVIFNGLTILPATCSPSGSGGWPPGG
jgi:hypothetical protein